MPKLRRAWFTLGCVLGLACGGSEAGLAGSPRNDPDAASTVDGEAADVGKPAVDGAVSPDGGAIEDADPRGDGAPPDSTDRPETGSPPPDAGVRADAGTALDGGAPADRTSTESGATPDVVPQPESGVPPESGTPLDGFVRPDSGAPPDGWSPPDGGPATDGGSLPTTQAVVAHRGASGHAPEHTFAAYDLAISMGADYVEQDVAMTADGVLVCLHDSTLNRTARGSAADCTGSVSTKTVAQLKTCDMGTWFNETYPDRARPEYAGAKIPTLEEVFQRYGATVRYYIETKTLSTATQMEPELLRLLNQYGLRDGAVRRHAVLVQSFDAASLQRMQALDGDIPLVLLGAATTAQIEAAAQYAFGIGPTSGSVNPTLIDTAHRLGLAVHPYTVNESADLDRLARLCVDGMFTNFPDRYRAIVDAGGLNCPPAIR